MTNDAQADRSGATTPHWWPLAATCVLLALLRAVAFGSHDLFSLAEIRTTPALLLQVWRLFVFSLLFELVVVCACVWLSYAGRLARGVAKGAVFALLSLNVLATVVFTKFHMYFKTYQITAITPGDMVDSVLSYLTPQVIGGALAAAAIAWFFDGRSVTARRPLRRTELAGVVALSLVVLGVSVRVNAAASNLPSIGQSPVAVALLRVEPDESPQLPAGTPEMRDWDAPPGGFAPAWAGRFPERPRFNVVMVVMESVRADQVWPSPGAPPMPRLAALAPHTAVFTHAYAHEPISLVGMEALMFGIYPEPEWKMRLRRAKDIGLDSVPARWAGLGHRSLFAINWDTNSAIDDFSTIIGPRGNTRYLGRAELQHYEPKGSDRALVTALDSFIGEAPQQPFGAVLWTLHTHVPYRLPPGEPGQPTLNSFEAYRATIAYTDKVIGDLVDMLERRGLAENTVLILTGDHGQAFDEHPGTGTGHGRSVCECSVRVPLLFVNPALFRGERDERIVQQKDVAATAAWLAGDPRPRLNVGTNVFLQHASHAAYAINTAEGFSGTVLSGDDKYVFTERLGDLAPAEVLYDLRADPEEKHDRLGQDPQRASALRQRLFGWHQVWRERWERATSVPDQRSRALVEGALLSDTKN